MIADMMHLAMYYGYVKYVFKRTIKIWFNILVLLLLLLSIIGIVYTY